jgi:hypothetical protein
MEGLLGFGGERLPPELRSDGRLTTGSPHVNGSRSRLSTEESA